jgi:outer membrane protein TolC
LQAQNELTAEDAIKIGVENNYSIRIARNTAEIIQNNTGKGTAGFLPVLNATGGYQYVNSQQETNSPLSFGNSDTRIENTVLQILAADFNLVQQEQLLDVARNARDISRTRLEKEQVRRNLGSASSTDFLNAQVSFNQDQSTLVNQELRTIIARKDLNILLAQNPDTPIQVRMDCSV